MVIEPHPDRAAAALPADAARARARRSRRRSSSRFRSRCCGRSWPAATRSANTDSDSVTDLRFDASTGRWVAIAPGTHAAARRYGDRLGRARGLPVLRRPRRPDAAGDAAASATARPAGTCASCRTSTRPSSARRWWCTGPTHLHSIGELSGATLDLVAEAWQRRAHDAGGICFPFVNEGHDAGASLPHSHSQLAWLPAPPPAAVAEHGLPEVVPVLERDGLVAGCPVASRVAYELLVYPGEPGADGLRSDAARRSAPPRRRAGGTAAS